MASKPETLTTSGGNPIADNQNSFTTGALDAGAQPCRTQATRPQNLVQPT
jgi:hypothetical protein